MLWLLQFPAIVVLALAAWLVGRAVWVWQNPRRRPRPGNSPAASTRPVAVVLGSGGHTGEMVLALGAVSKAVWALQRPLYIVSATDKDSAAVAIKFEKDTLGRIAAIATIPRAREVGQSYFSSVFTTLTALKVALGVVWRANPDVILTNGPGVCVPVVAATFFWAILVPTRSRAAVTYFESFTCVDHLSLSGKLLLPVADVFTVQWPALAEKLRGRRTVHYCGPFVAGRPWAVPLLPSGFAAQADGAGAPKMPRRAVVTVGSTRFDALIRAVDDDAVYDALATRLGIEELLIQKGRSQVAVAGPKGDVARRLRVTTVEYKPHLGDDIRGACLVISHAGAGTILEALKANVPTVVVPNPLLMGNHQRPLADALAARKHIFCVEVDDVAARLGGLPFDSLQELPPANVLAVRKCVEPVLAF